MTKLSTFDVATLENAIEVLRQDESEESIKIIDDLNDYIVANTIPEN